MFHTVLSLWTLIEADVIHSSFRTKAAYDEARAVPKHAGQTEHLAAPAHDSDCLVKFLET